jgi:hypothetical protein
MLVAFSNRGSKSFLVQRIDSNFRYAHDYNYIILNVSVICKSNQTVHATLKLHYELD